MSKLKYNVFELVHREDNKTPTSSVKTLKPSGNESEGSTPAHSKKSLSSQRCSTPEESSDNQAKKSFLKTPDQNKNLNSSPETPENSSSFDGGIVKEGIKKFLKMRRQSLSSISVRSGSTITNVSVFTKSLKSVQP